MDIDAIVPAGGRASRLGGIAKPLLTIGGISLLQRATDAAAAAGARRTVVVGPPEQPAPAGVLRTREDPPFGGPVAAVAAGLLALDRAAAAAGTTPADWLLVLASDQPGVAGMTPVLLDALHRAERGRQYRGERGLDPATDPGADAVIGTDPAGHRQYLAACYRRERLREVLAQQESGGAGGSMKRLVAGLGVIDVALPGEAVGDVDTPSDAARWGVAD